MAKLIPDASNAVKIMKTIESDIDYCKKAILHGSSSFHAASLKPQLGPLELRV